MKRLLFAVVCMLFVVASSAKAADLDNSKIYHFYQPMCPHCHEAIDYINAQYPGLKMELININSGRENFDLFMRCVRKFKLGNQIGTPLFCMGNRYIMGWSDEQKLQFDEYVKDFLK